MINTITRSVNVKFNCITVKYNGTQHGICDVKQVQLKEYLIS